MTMTALYARVSTELQEQEQTIQSQLAAIRHYAEDHGYHTMAALTYIDEGFSGSRLDRPALDELRDHAREGRFQALVVLCPDRLARKYAYQVLLIEELARVGVSVHFCERPITDSPDDQLLLQIQGAIAEYERAKILERCRRGRLYRARLGELGHSHPPYGYRYAPKRYGGDGRIRIHEEEATTVRQIFAWYAEDGMTLYKLLQRLNVSPWRPQCGKPTWTGTTVLRMLRCEWYIGKAYYNRTRSRSNERSGPDGSGRKIAKMTLIPRPPAEWIAVAVPPIIDEPLFARVQQRIQENRRFARRRLKQEGVFLLKGLLKCGVCGHAYVGETRHEPRRRRDGSQYLYHYYTCCARITTINSGLRHRCKNWRLHVAGVNEAVWTTVRDLLLNSDALHQQLAAWVERTTTTRPEQDPQFQHAEQRVKELCRQRDRLTDAYQLGALSLAVFRTRTEVVEESLRSAELALAELKTARLEAEVTRTRADGAAALVEQLRPHLLEADFDTKQTILRLLVERVIVTEERLEIQLAIPVSGNFRLTFKDSCVRQSQSRRRPRLLVGADAECDVCRVG
ncbi:MAG TPA: recombinase family protein, partial [Steroidobacteraceae bacterium]|nr:recombinase family protein [Steroidobacteraceae bacterium]